MSHRLTDIIVTDQSQRYIYITSGAADPLTPHTRIGGVGLGLKMELKGQDRPLVGVPVPVRVSSRGSSSRRRKRQLPLKTRLLV